MILVLNLALEFLALTATWTRRLHWLRAFLVYELLSDAASTLVPHRGFGPWYYYWVGRSIDLVLMMLATYQKDEKKIITAWRVLSLLAFMWMLVHTWTGKLTNSAMGEMLLVGFLLLTTLLFLMLVLLPRDWCLWTGFVAWVVALFLPLQWYSRMSLVPLAIWSSAFLWRRGWWHHARGEKLDEVYRGGWGKDRHTQNRADILPETVR